VCDVFRPPSVRSHVGKDDDSESGRGASLPQSPVTVESDSSDANTYQQTTKRSPSRYCSSPTVSRVSSRVEKIRVLCFLARVSRKACLSRGSGVIIAAYCVCDILRAFVFQNQIASLLFNDSSFEFQSSLYVLHCSC